jgi:hypothetical protein
MIVSIIAVVVGFYRLDGQYTPGPLVAAVVVRLPDRQTVADAAGAVAGTVKGVAKSVTALLSPPEEPAPVTTATAPLPPAVSGTPPAAPSAAPSAGPAPAPAPTAAAPAAPSVPEAARPSRPPPPPIDWFEPLTRGYTIDLVLIAGFWAVFNALRVVFVIVKVAANARLTSTDYLFRTLVPVRFETAGGPRYVVAERLSSSTAILAGALGGIGEDDLAAGLSAVAYLPSGAAHMTLRPKNEGWVPQAKTRTAAFSIECASDADRNVLEDGLYTTSWHRECHHNDAEFTTPIGALIRLFGGDRRDRSVWRAALVLDDDHAEPMVALLRASGELLLLAEAEPRNAVVRIVTFKRDGWQQRHLLLRELVSSAPLHASYAHARKIYRYRTEESAEPANVTLLPRRGHRRNDALAAGTVAAGDRATAG